AEHAVLVQLEFLGLRDLAQLDVVRLRSCEVLHRGAETGRFDDAQIDLQSAGESYRCTGVALRGDLRDLVELPKALDNRGGLGGGAGDHNVEVADRFLAPPEAAGYVDLVYGAPSGLQVFHDRPRILLGFVQHHTLLRRGRRVGD